MLGVADRADRWLAEGQHVTYGCISRLIAWDQDGKSVMVKPDRSRCGVVVKVRFDRPRLRRMA
jgi:hypothetical protein